MRNIVDLMDQMRSACELELALRSAATCELLTAPNGRMGPMGIAHGASIVALVAVAKEIAEAAKD